MEGGLRVHAGRQVKLGSTVAQATAKLSADSAVSALEATKLILERAESLEASRKAESLDGFTPEPAK